MTLEIMNYLGSLSESLEITTVIHAPYADITKALASDDLSRLLSRDALLTAQTQVENTIRLLLLFGKA